MTLKVDIRDVGVICAFYPEHLDTGELLKEPVPQNKILQGIVVRRVKLEGNTEFLHGGKPSQRARRPFATVRQYNCTDNTN
jgi:hypothetical protein